jgi:hypothetical protein
MQKNEKNLAISVAKQKIEGKNLVRSSEIDQQ